MQKIEGGKLFQLIMTPELLEGVDRVAQRHGLTRAEALRRLLDFGLDIYDDLHSVGFVQLVEIFAKGKDLVENGIQRRLFKH